MGGWRLASAASRSNGASGEERMRSISDLALARVRAASSLVLGEMGGCLAVGVGVVSFFSSSLFSGLLLLGFEVLFGSFVLKRACSWRSWHVRLLGGRRRGRGYLLRTDEISIFLLLPLGNVRVVKALLVQHIIVHKPAIL